jgi:FAD:protein FMN transferase
MCIRMLNVSRVLLLLALALGCQAGGGGGAGDEAAEAVLLRFDFARKSMGVEFRIILFAQSALQAETASAAAFERIEDLDGKLSHYKPDSELNRLVRRGGGGERVGVSQDLWRVLQLAESYSKVSGGVFDVTVGPLTLLWRKARLLGRLPRAVDREAAMARVGHGMIHLDVSNGLCVWLDSKDMALDLGGIAKGYAVDRALEVLRQHGITRVLVDGSGDIAVWDPPPNKDGWTIAVSPTGELETRYLSMRRAAIATSGDSYGRVVINGKRYSHIVDPHTGLGLVDSAAVTVLAPDCAQADALATVVSLLGAAAGIEVLESIPQTGAIIHRKPSPSPSDKTQEFQYPKDLEKLPFVLSSDPRKEGAMESDKPAASVEKKK